MWLLANIITYEYGFLENVLLWKWLDLFVYYDINNCSDCISELVHTWPHTLSLVIQVEQLFHSLTVCMCGPHLNRLFPPILIFLFVSADCNQATSHCEDYLSAHKTCPWKDWRQEEAAEGRRSWRLLLLETRLVESRLESKFTLRSLSRGGWFSWWLHSAIWFFRNYSKIRDRRCLLLLGQQQIVLSWFAKESTAKQQHEAFSFMFHPQLTKKIFKWIIKISLLLHLRGTSVNAL